MNDTNKSITLFTYRIAAQAVALLGLYGAWTIGERFVAKYALFMSTFYILQSILRWGLDVAALRHVKAKGIDPDDSIIYAWSSILVIQSFLIIIIAHLTDYYFYDETFQSVVYLLWGASTASSFALISFVGEVNRGLGRTLTAESIQIWMPGLIFLGMVLSVISQSELEERVFKITSIFVFAISIAVSTSFFSAISYFKSSKRWFNFFTEKLPNGIGSITKSRAIDAFLANLDVVMAGLFFNSIDAALYATAARLAGATKLAMAVVNGVAVSFFAGITTGVTDSNYFWERYDVFRKKSIILFLICLLGIFGILLASQNFDISINFSMPALIILILSSAISASYGPCGSALQYSGFYYAVSRLLTKSLYLLVFSTTVSVFFFSRIEGLAISVLISTIYWNYQCLEFLKKEYKSGIL